MSFYRAVRNIVLETINKSISCISNVNRVGRGLIPRARFSMHPVRNNWRIFWGISQKVKVEFLVVFVHVVTISSTFIVNLHTQVISMYMQFVCIKRCACILKFYLPYLVSNMRDPNGIRLEYLIVRFMLFNYPNNYCIQNSALGLAANNAPLFPFIVFSPQLKQRSNEPIYF